MPDIWMDVDTALAEVPVNILPLIDDTDFKTIEDAIAYNAAGMDLTWNFATSAGAFTSTSVTPTSAGVHDWNEHTADDGMYTLEIPASAGTINNDTEGTGWFTGVITGVLPFRGPTIGFRAAALNDALIDGGDVLDVNLTEIGGTAQSATDLKDFADAGYDPATNKVQGVVLADTVTTLTGHTAQTGDNYARLGAPAGANVSADIAAIEAQTDDIGVAGAGLTAVPWNAAWDAQVESEATDALNAYDPPTRSELTTDTNSVLSKLLKYVQLLMRSDAAIETDNATELTAINADEGSGAGDYSAQTDSLEASQTEHDNTQTNIAGLNDPTAATIADAVWDESATGHTDAGKAGEQLWTDVDAILLDTNELQTDDVPGLIAALNDLTAAAVNAEVVDALATDTYAEPTGVPGATVALATKIGYLYMALRNQLDVTSTKKTFYDDGGVGEWEKDLSDDGSTYSESEANAI